MTNTEKSLKEKIELLSEHITNNICGDPKILAKSSLFEENPMWKYWKKYYTEAIDSLLSQAKREMALKVIDDLEFRLIDNRISQYDEKYAIMKADIEIVKSHLINKEDTKEKVERENSMKENILLVLFFLFGITMVLLILIMSIQKGTL